jgi:hypothetical protein
VGISHEDLLAFLRADVAGCALLHYLSNHASLVVFDGLVFSVLATGPKVCRFKPVRG